MKIPDHSFPVLMACLLSLPALASEDKLVLTVTVSGAKPETGQIFLSLFTSPENYLKEPVQYKELPVGDSDSVTWSFKNLEPGDYAVSAIYDEDGNGKLNTGFLGIPKELIGMSNDAKGVFGPPSFKKSSFSLTQSDQIEIRLGKAKD